MRSKWVAAIGTAALVAWVTASALAQGAIEVAGAGAGPFPSGTAFNLVPLEAIRVGMGATASPTGGVMGDLHATLVGTSAAGLRREIAYDALVTSVSVSDGTATLLGVGTVNMGDGTAPLLSVPFTMTATQNTVQLLLGTTTLPQTTLNQGAITIK